MKNLVLTSLFSMAIVSATFATNNETKTAASTTVETSVPADETLSFTSENLNYYNVIRNLEVNDFVKLIQLNDYNAVKNLVIAGADINEKSKGLTPLMHAARQNRVQVVKLLIAQGAKMDAQSKYGYTALDYAKMSGATESLELIKNANES